MKAQLKWEKKLQGFSNRQVHVEILYNSVQENIINIKIIYSTKLQKK